MNTARRTIVAIAIVCGLTARVEADVSLTIVTTTEDLASLVREIGGEAVSVEAIARGYQDPHFVEPKPSFILKLTKADLGTPCPSHTCARPTPSCPGARRSY